MLYLIATPIGHLGDLSQRAIETLNQVDYIVCEDTRHSGHLFKKLEIKKPLISFHIGNEHKTVAHIRNLLSAGHDLALVCNAGTPGIADPGFLAVRDAIEHELPCTVVPGPCAFVAALVLSGMPLHAFNFRTFPPRKSGKRRSFFEADRLSPHTLVFYESPHRLVRSLEDARAVLGDRPACIANDLTKKFESLERGPLSTLIAGLEGNSLKGEFTVVIHGHLPEFDPVEDA